MPRSPLLVLVVDDDEDVREAAAATVIAAGHRVVAASDGAEALRQVEAARPDVILLDMMMPDVDGLEFLERVPRECSAPIPPIIAYSGFDKFEQLALSHGASAFFRKPFHPERLIEALEAEARGAVPPRAVDDVESADRAEDAREALLHAVRLRDPVWREQLRWLTRWAAGYFGVEKSFVGIFHCNGLTLLAQSGALDLPEDSPLDPKVSLCPLVTRAKSPLVVRDTKGAGPFGDPAASGDLRFYAGAPLLTGGGTSLGAFCVRDSRPFDFHAEDLAVLSYFGHLVGRGFAAMLDDGGDLTLFHGECLLSPDSLRVLIDAELRRAERDGAVVALVIAAATACDNSVDAVVRAAGTRHVARATVDRDLTAILLGSSTGERADARTHAVVTAMQHGRPECVAGVAHFDARARRPVGPGLLLEAAMLAYREGAAHGHSVFKSV